MELRSLNILCFLPLSKHWKVSYEVCNYNGKIYKYIYTYIYCIPSNIIHANDFLTVHTVLNNSSTETVLKGQLINVGFTLPWCYSISCSQSSQSTVDDERLLNDLLSASQHRLCTSLTPTNTSRSVSTRTISAYKMPFTQTIFGLQTSINSLWQEYLILLY